MADSLINRFGVPDVDRMLDDVRFPKIAWFPRKHVGRSPKIVFDLTLFCVGQF